MTAFTDRQLAKFSNSAPTASSYRSIGKKSNIRNFSPISDVMLYALGHSVRKSVFILILQACSCWTHDNKINADNSNICYVQSQDVWYVKIGKKQYQRKSPKLNFELTYMFARPDPPRHNLPHNRWTVEQTSNISYLPYVILLIIPPYLVPKRWLAIGEKGNRYVQHTELWNYRKFEKRKPTQIAKLCLLWSHLGFSQLKQLV